MAVGCPRCVQEVTLKGAPKNKFGEAVVQFQGVPDFSPRRELIPGPAAGPGAFPPASATPEDVPLVVELRNGGPCVMVRPERA